MYWTLRPLSLFLTRDTTGIVGEGQRAFRDPERHRDSSPRVKIAFHRIHGIKPLPSTKSRSSICDCPGQSVMVCRAPPVETPGTAVPQGGN